MATTNAAVPMSKKDQIKIMRRDLAPALSDVITAEAVLLDAQTAASKRIGDLITKSGNPQHKFTLNKGEATEQKIMATFRKIGEYIGDKDGNPVTPGADGGYAPGSKPFPLYGMKLADMADDDD